MSDPEPSHRISPILLARARELRQEMTYQERKLWARLRGRQLHGRKFRRQHPIHRFVLDFYCHGHKLVIEIDGPSHAEPEQQIYDRARTEWLEGQGLRVIRFSNREVDGNIEGVLEAIAQALSLIHI